MTIVYRKQCFVVVVLLIIIVLSAFGATLPPNPIAQFYSGSEGYPMWTDQLKWSNQVTMVKKNSGTENFKEFERVRDQLFSQGGGVMYYPEGVYEFEVPLGPNGRGLLLKDGVVILGARPASDDKAVKSYDVYGLSQLKTVFKFTSKENGYQAVQNFIGATPADANRIGISWVSLENAYIYFGFNATKWAATWSSAECWLAGLQIGAWNDRKPDGTLIFDPFVGDGFTGKWASGDAIYGSMRFVFGCKLVNAYIQNYVVNSGNCTPFSADQESYRFGGVISVYGSHVFVANNVLPKVTEEIKNDRLCIDVNKQLLAMYDNRCDVKNRKGYYAGDVVVKDNWVYNKGNKSYEIAGSYAVIRDNVAHKDFVDTAYKFRTCQGGQVGVADYMNRGFDFGGFSVWAHNNEVRETGSRGNDGEGMLVQRHNEIELFSHAYTLNQAFAHPGQAADKGYIASYDVHATGFLLFKNKSSGNVGLRKVVVRDKNGNITAENHTSDISVVKNEAAAGVSIVDVKDVVSDCPSGTLSKVSNIKIEMTDFGQKLSWVDNANNEIGFRIDRRVGTSAPYTVVYRPRHSLGSKNLTYKPSGAGGGGPCDCTVDPGYDFNPQEWIDYLVPVGAQSVQYRIVAINCDDSDVGASDWINANINVTAFNKVMLSDKKISVTVNNGTIRLSGVMIETVSLSVINSAGRVVATEKELHIDKNGLQIKQLVRGCYVLILRGKGIEIQRKLFLR